jgi:hypothetical protein
MQYAYTVIIEKSENNYGAWAPDLPGCVTTGPIIEETLANMRKPSGFTWKECARTAIRFRSRPRLRKQSLSRRLERNAYPEEPQGS